MIAALLDAYGLLRSILMYYGPLPFRARRQERFYARFIRPGDLCFDIGAHVGSRLRIWSRLGARTVAAEPQPLFFRFLQRLYGRRPEIILLAAAVGAAPGQADLRISRLTPTVSSLSVDWMEAVHRARSFARVRWDTVTRVPVTTLDALIAEYGEPAFCKIDVEGSEPEALAGLSRPLPSLSFEYTPAAVGRALACLERLERLGNYEYNAAVGETLRLRAERWTEASEMMCWLDSLALDDPSGDIYTRRLASSAELTVKS